MSRVRRSSVIVTSLLLLASATALLRAADDFGVTTTVTLPKGWKAENATLADVNGDGRDDLLVASSRRRPRTVRRVSIHLRRDGRAAFGPTADHTYELTPDVVAFTAADVQPGGGAELILLTATGAFAWQPTEADDARPERLVRADVLWQGPHPREVLNWDHGVRDLDGDGLVDLLLPEPSGYCVALQRRTTDSTTKQTSHTFHATHLRLPDGLNDPEPMSRGARRMRGKERRRKFRIALGLGADPELGKGDLFAITDAVPAPVAIDWDADGDLDVVAQTEDELLVWTCRDGQFSVRPNVTERLPLDVDRSRRLDVSFSSHAAHLDTDRRADCVILAGDRRSDDARTQVLVYRQADRSKSRDDPGGALFREDGVPGQALIVAGFAGVPQIIDVNGDGSTDLVLSSVDVDGIDAISAAASGRIDAKISIYLGRKGVLPRRPNTSFTISVDAKSMRGQQSVDAAFFGDATGNGARDVLVQPGDGTLAVKATQRSRKGVSIRDEPVWSTRIADRAEVLEFERPGGPELLILEAGRVLHVRFR